MAKLDTDDDRYGGAPSSVLVEAVHNAVRDLVRRRFSACNDPWSAFVFGSSNALITKSDFEAIEARILETGYRFAWSSMLSLRDRPGIYADAGEADKVGASFSFEHVDAPFLEAEAQGLELHGVGDNVVRHASNTNGIASYIRTSERVLSLMKNGVPDDLIAIIDDSGGTLTAPVLEKFKGVICAGGTVRSHLGILTREYGIPCLMNAKIAGIHEGDRVEIETTAAAKTGEAYQRGQEMTARIWKVIR
jgi:phosphohistidine swiveling domain-containing protein